MTLVEEALDPGSFENNFKEACASNNLPEIHYVPKEGTARAFFAAMTGNSDWRGAEGDTHTHASTGHKQGWD